MKGEALLDGRRVLLTHARIAPRAFQSLGKKEPGTHKKGKRKKG
jgi:hypothetical protein